MGLTIGNVMSEQELYELATKRVNQRTRRWRLWALDLLGLIFVLMALIAFGERNYANLIAAVFIGWMGMFAVHSIFAWMAENRDGDIEKEVAKLRAALEYEKPKRLELSDDGELVDWDAETAEKAKHST
jgi:hypothetical protein